jgi:KUP system potassium uptake protein
MTIVPTAAPGMSGWQKNLFLLVARNAADPVTYFGLPDDATVVMGSRVTL